MGMIWRFTVEKLEFHQQKLDFLAMNQGFLVGAMELWI